MAFVMNPICDPSRTNWASDDSLRRNISVFSRRGSDSPPPQFEQALMASSMSLALSNAIPGFHSEPPPRVKRWRLSRQKTVSRASRGTILRAVPEDPPQKRKSILTALEVEMATAPNDEILRKIGRNPIDARIAALPSPVRSPSTPGMSETPVTKPLASRSKQRSSSRGRSERTDGSIIGIWQDGQARFEQSPATPTSKGHDVPHLRRSGTAIKTSKRTSAKPRVKLLIPDLSSPLPALTFEPFDAAAVSSQSLIRSKTVSHIATGQVGHMAHTSRHAARRSETHRGGITVSSPVMSSPLPLQSQATIRNAATLESVTQRLSRHSNLTVRNPTLPSSNSSVTSGQSDDEDRLSVRSSRTSMTSVSSTDERHSGAETEAASKYAGMQNLKSRSSRSVRFASVTNVIDPTAASTVGKIGTRSHPAELEGSPVVQPAPSMAAMARILRRPSVERPVKRLSSRRGNLLLKRMNSRGSAKSHSTSASNSKAGTPPRASSPTLQEAEDELETQLRRWSGSSTASLQPPTVESGSSLAPAVPPKSPRRSFVAPVARRKSSRTVRHQALNKKSTHLKRNPLDAASIDDNAKQVISAQQGMAVVRMILERLDSLDDLFSTATVNKAFYRVFKRNELAIIKTVLCNMCTPAWECCETQTPLTPESDNVPDRLAKLVIPSAYLEEYRNDTYTIGALKDIILDQCTELLRPTSIEALKTRDGRCNSDMDVALWRIWTFCRIFGSGRSRVSDLTGQMDWLRGGALAHQEQCTGTISTNDALMMSSVLLSAPSYFGKGNGGNGLGAEQLFDMLEMWSCLNHITRGVLGRPEQARDYGVFGEVEESMACNNYDECILLEEFQAYILSLGLGPTLDIATHAASPSPSVFRFAQSRGLTSWTPPTRSGTIPTRRDFLREAVTRVYEQRLLETFAQPEVRLSHIKSLRRQREIRQSVFEATKRQSLGSVERPALRIDTLNSPTPVRFPAVPRKSVPGLLRAVSPTKALRPTSLVLPAQKSIQLQQPNCGRPEVRAVSLDTATTLQPILPLNTRQSRAVSLPIQRPIARDPQACPTHPPPPPPAVASILSACPTTMQQLNGPAQNGTAAFGNSADRALARIVEMGFTVTQAKGALKITDMGDGLSVGRAVEYLLRLGEGDY